jgi:hypothetical protein
MLPSAPQITFAASAALYHLHAAISPKIEQRISKPNATQFIGYPSISVAARAAFSYASKLDIDKATSAVVVGRVEAR